MADQIDLLNHLLFVTYRVAAGTGVKPEHLKNPPKPLPRPGDEQVKKKIRFGTVEDARKALGG